MSSPCASQNTKIPGLMLRAVPGDGGPPVRLECLEGAFTDVRTASFSPSAPVEEPVAFRGRRSILRPAGTLKGASPDAGFQRFDARPPQPRGKRRRAVALLLRGGGRRRRG